jgi:hypothetical protein
MMRRFVRHVLVSITLALSLAGCGDCESGTGTIGSEDGGGDTTVDSSPTDTVDDGAETDGDDEDTTSDPPFADGDGDLVANINDNCPETANTDQADADGDGRGDACDNCPDTPNYPQVDTDQDGEGDVCEVEPAGPICDEVTSDFEILQPNIYFVIDRSTSMRRQDGTNESRMVRAKAGLDLIAEQLASQLRIGISVYPCANENAACDQLNKEILSVGNYTTRQLKDAYGTNYTAGTCPHGSAIGLSGLDIEEGGKHCTETGSALRDVRDRMLYTDPSDQKDGQREKAVILITDGGACGCSAQAPAVQAARDMNQAGIDTYVVGFNFSDSRLDEIAEAGGTDAPPAGGDRFYSASNATELVDALKSIQSSIIQCSYTLDPPPQDENRIWVEVDGDFIPEGGANGYAYDSASNTLTLNTDACSKLQSASTQGGNVPLEISLGCGCDEDMQTCACIPEGGDCTTDGDCCVGGCDDGLCESECSPITGTCQDDSDCCGSTAGCSQNRCVGG